MLISEAFFSFLKDNLETPVFPVLIPSTATLPAIATQRTSNHEPRLQGPGLDHATFTVSVVSPTLADCWSITETLINTLAPYTGSMGDFSVSVSYTDSDEDFEPNDGSDGGLFIVNSSFVVLYSR